jgi:hypothetical protein
MQVAYGIIGDIQQKERAFVADAVALAEAALSSKKYATQLPVARSEMLRAPTNTYGAGHKAAYWLALASTLGYPSLLVEAKAIEAQTRGYEEANVLNVYKPGFSEAPADIAAYYTRAANAMDAVGGRSKTNLKGVYAVFGIQSTAGAQSGTREQRGDENPITGAGGGGLFTVPITEAVAAWVKGQIPEGLREEDWKKYVFWLKVGAGTLAVGTAVGIYLIVRKPKRTNRRGKKK